MMEPEQRVAGRGEDIIIDTGDELMAGKMCVEEERWLEGVDAWVLVSQKLTLSMGGRGRNP